MNIATNISARARHLLDTSLVWDNHGCLPMEDTERCCAELVRYRDSGVTAVSINIGDSFFPLDTLVRVAADIRHFVAKNPDHYLMVSTIDDVRRARETARLAVAFDIEGVQALGDQLSLIQLMYDIGVRWMAMVYNNRNQVGYGCQDEVDEGLTPYGRAFIAEMDRVGMVKCCSHTGYRTARDVLEASTKPVIFSHSNPRKLKDHPRNIPDDLIRACAATGGVVGINGVGIFLGDNDNSAEAMARHIDYVSQLVGAKHVGLGLDYVFDQTGMEEMLAAHASTWPASLGYTSKMRFVEPEKIPAIVERLVDLGYADADIRGILGDNLMRVAAAVWK